jgi:hypothetical protein
MIGDTTNHSSAFFFNTLDALKQYLSDKYVKGKNWAKAYFNQVIAEGKFHKTTDDQFEMGYAYQSKELLVVPFPEGGIMA